jgi:hypothetical protein
MYIVPETVRVFVVAFQVRTPVGDPATVDVHE